MKRKIKFVFIVFAIFNSEQKLFSILIEMKEQKKNNEIIKKHTIIEVFTFIKKYK